MAFTAAYTFIGAARLIGSCPFWCEQLDRVLFEIGFMSDEARAAEIVLKSASGDIALAARGFAAVGKVDHILDVGEPDASFFSYILSKLQGGEMVLLIDRERTPLLTDFARDWAFYCGGSSDTVVVNALYKIRSLHSQSVENLGFLGVMRPGSHGTDQGELFELLALRPEEVDVLERIGEYSLQPIEQYNMPIFQ
jgi:hypothetical protein